MSAIVTEQIHVIALGASNTAGYGVARDLAYPAVVEQLLRARGHDVRVGNAGISGNTTAEMLARLPRDIPPGTHIVLSQPGSNDARRGVADVVREENIASIVRALDARAIIVVRVAAAFAAVPPGHLQPDGIHFTISGHEWIARALADQVATVLGERT